MKSGWQTKPFEDCVGKVTYTPKVQRKDFLDNGAYPIISQEDEFINGYWDNEADLFKVTTPIVVFGDHTKVLKYVDFDFVLGADGVKVLQPRDFLLPKFFFYELQTANLDSLGYARHYKLLKELEIVYPARPEQQRIVGILDEAFEGIATAKTNAEKNLQNARALFESHLQSVFTQRGSGWVEKPLGNLASFRNGINYTKDSKGERIKIVGVRNFQKNFCAPLDDLDTVTIDGELSELDSLRQDDILAVRSNGNIELIGRCILVGEVKEKISHSGFTIRIRLSNGKVLPKYLCHFMKSASSRKRLTDGGTGTNIKSLNQGMLSALAITFPPISVQIVLVEKLESLSEETQSLVSIYQQKLAALESLKKSLLHQAFTGQLAGAGV